MKTVALLASLLLAPVATAFAAGDTAPAGAHHLPPPGRDIPRPDCDELEECFAEGLGLSNDQQDKVHAIMEDARKRRDELREDTFNSLKDVLTPEQARKLEAHRSELMRYRAQRMRNQADRLDRRARDMKSAGQAPSR